MPKPWPENPLIRKNPGTDGTGPITGTASGVVSISPPQLCAILRRREGGEGAHQVLPAFLDDRRVGRGSSTRVASNGLAWSSVQRRGNARFLRNRPNRRMRYSFRVRIIARQESRQQAETVGHDEGLVFVAASDRVAAVRALAEREVGAGDGEFRRAV